MKDKDLIVKDKLHKLIAKLEDEMFETEKKLKQQKEEHIVLVKILEMLEDK